MAALSPEEIAGLKFMREEEKLAHDVYVALYSVWGANVFSQIAVSETTHTETILALLVKYGIADPAAGKAPGVFEDPALQALYNTLIAMGQPSLIDALKVGALIEETDIHDINEKKAVTGRDRHPAGLHQPALRLAQPPARLQRATARKRRHLCAPGPHPGRVGRHCQCRQRDLRRLML